ncbi:MAG: TraB/GumN family protein [Myroides sp.]|nr:TraB/GumN family protein [Myroides sp.]
MKKLVKSIAICALTLVSFTTFAQDNKSLLWQISGKGLEKPSYVFGTIHMICQEDYIMTETIQNTLKNVDAFYAEIDFSNPENMAVLQQSMMSETPLSQRLNNEQYQKLQQLLKEVVDLDITQFEHLTDAAIVSMVTFKSFPCTDFKMYEMELLQTAAAAEKKMGGLETAAEQMEILGKSLGIDAVFEMLNDLKKDGFKSTKEMVALYTNQDVQGLYDYMKKSSYMTDEVYNEMLTKRNHNWINEMPALMKNQSVFFAVGAAHLSGNNGVLKLLKDNGYTVKPVDIQ